MRILTRGGGVGGHNPDCTAVCNAFRSFNCHFPIAVVNRRFRPAISPEACWLSFVRADRRGVRIPKYRNREVCLAPTIRIDRCVCVHAVSVQSYSQYELSIPASPTSFCLFKTGSIVQLNSLLVAAGGVVGPAFEKIRAECRLSWV